MSKRNDHIHHRLKFLPLHKGCHRKQCSLQSSPANHQNPVYIYLPGRLNNRLLDFPGNNRYYFDINRLGEFHKQNQDDFKQSLANGTDVVICDNTNLQPWQTEPYTRIARENGYRIIFLNFLPRELWKHVQSQHHRGLILNQLPQ